MGHRIQILKRLVLGLLVALLSVTEFGCAPHARAPEPERALPTLELRRLDGSPSTLSALISGKPALVTFWATWCDSCNRETEALNRLFADVTEQGAGTVVGIDEGEVAELVSGFVAQHGVRYAQLLDSDFRFSDELDARRVPTTLVVDRTGKLVYRGGALDAAALDAFRRALR
jgi:peroxiredoxin